MLYNKSIADAHPSFLMEEAILFSTILIYQRFNRQGSIDSKF